LLFLQLLFLLLQFFAPLRLCAFAPLRLCVKVLIWVGVMATKWILREHVAPPPELIAEVGGHRLVAELLAQRGILTVERARAFLDPLHYAPAPPQALFGLEHAAQVLWDAIRRRRRILVWGDFDVDGQTSTALYVTALRRLLAPELVTFFVPNRFTDGHGMRVPRLSQVLDAADPLPHLILTCDTGIADAEGVSYAKDRGLTVVVTDHHDLPDELKRLTPGVDTLWGLSTDAVGTSVRRADALLDPMLSPADSPLRTLPGVGVAFKLIQRIYELAGRSGEEDDLLDLVALGIVADVALQVNDARYLLQLGLERLRATQREGLIALMEVARVTPQRLTAESIGFQLGPRLNALGRLEDASPSIEMLSTTDIYRARQLAAYLEGLNLERRRRTRETTSEAMAMVVNSPHLLDYNALVLAHEHWHAGIVGIVASRMVEEFGKPALLLLVPPGENARGSARSVPGIDIGAAIAACAPLLITHGGHAGAAGVSLRPENIEPFRQELSRQVLLHRDPTVEDGALIDAELDFAEIDLALAHELNRLAPFGAGNPLPRFLTRNVVVQNDSRIGAEGIHRRLMLRQTKEELRTEGSTQGKSVQLQMIWFGGGDVELPVGNLDVVYTIGINRYQGNESVQLQYVGVRAAEEARTVAGEKWLGPATVHDLRGETIALEELPGPDVAAWYAEGAQVGANGALPAYAPRQDAVRGQRRELVLWSIPPDQHILQWLLESVQPETVYVCGKTTTDDRWETIRAATARMCKYALTHDGVADLARMAARIGATEAIVRQTMRWLEAEGEITLGEWEGDRVPVTAGARTKRHQQSEGLPDGDAEVFPDENLHSDGSDGREIEANARMWIEEMRAWRTFFRRESLDDIGFRRGSR